MKVQYTNGLVLDPACAVIWEDLHCERSGFYRAYWGDGPDATSGSPVVGYCSPGGSHRLIRQVVAEFRRMYPGEPIYRNGRLCK